MEYKILEVDFVPVSYFWACQDLSLSSCLLKTKKQKKTKKKKRKEKKNRALTNQEYAPVTLIQTQEKKMAGFTPFP